MNQTPKDLSRLRIDRSEGSSTGRGGWLVALTLLLGLLAYAGWRGFSAVENRPSSVQLGRARRVGGAEAQTGVAANGYVVARRRAALSTDVQGRVVAIPVEEGDAVEKGQLIARLDTTQLAASLERFQSERKKALATRRLAEVTLERQSALVASGHASLAARDAALAALDETKAQVEAMAASEREIQTMIRKSSVHAPFAGVITQKNAEVGEVVSSLGAGGGANARGSVATLVDFETLEVQVELAQTSLRAARVQAPVLIYLDAYPDDAYRGRVRQIWPTANRQKATVELRIEFIERDERILPEMGARIVFVPDEAEAKEPEVFVPDGALVRDPKPHVFLYNGDPDGGSGGRVTRRTVVPGDERQAGLVRIDEGLVGQEQVVLDPPPSLRDGDRVLRKEE